MRKVKQILKIPYNKADHDELCLKRVSSFKEFRDVRIEGDELVFAYGSSAPVFARLWPHSDSIVLEQVFRNGEYKVATDFFRNNLPSRKDLHIIDAGANVGYSSIFFLNEFPEAKIACIEPDEKNVLQLEKNLSSEINRDKVRIFRNGLMQEHGKNIITDKDFRDGKDWSVSVKETDMESNLKSITVEQVMKEMSWDFIDILKIDIEGAERFVFDQSASLDYLEKVSSVAVEIHDEFGIREQIYGQLRKYGFAIFDFGETTFGIKKSLLTN